MNKKLIRIAKYLANNGLYEEASEIKKLANLASSLADSPESGAEELTQDDKDKLLEAAKTALNNNKKLTYDEEALDLYEEHKVDSPTLNAWANDLEEQLGGAWLPSTKAGDEWVEVNATGHLVLKASLKCIEGKFEGCMVVIFTYNKSKKTQVQVDFGDGFPEQLELRWQ